MPRTRRPVSLHALRRPTAVAIGSTLAFAAAAQTDPAANTPQADRATATVETITVTGRRTDDYTVKDSAAATKLPLTPRETPQSLTVITRERLDDQKLTSLRDVLDSTPGIYSNAYDTERVLFYARGFLVDSLLHDGVPAITNFNTGSIDETIDTALYERIEIVRGATGLMTGAGNPAASINLVRKHADSKTTELSADLTLGSWNTRRLELDASVPLTADGRIRARGVAVAEDKDSYQDLYSKQTYVLYGIVDADLTPATRVSLGFDYQDKQPQSVTWGSFPLYLGDGSLADWPRSVTTATDWSYWNRKTQTVFGELEHRFDSGWSLRANLSHRRFEEDSELFYVFGYPDPVTGEGLDPYAYKSDGKVVETSLDVFATGPFELLGRKHALVAGFNSSRAKNTGSEQEPVSLAPTGNFFDWDGSYPRPDFAPATPTSDIKTTQHGLYAAGRFSLADSLKLITGARYAKWDVDSFYVYDTPADSKYGWDKVIPYAGLVWDFAPQFSAFTSYTSIFKPQNNRDINRRYLDPIDGRSFEVGIKGEHMDGRLNTALTVFDTRQNNVAAPVLDENGEQVTVGPDRLPVSKAIDGTQTRGFEIEVSGRLSNEVQGSFGWTRYITKDGDDQTIRTYIPSTLVRLFATWEPRRWVQDLTLGGGINWQSDSSTLVGHPDGGAVLHQDSVTQLSLMARYQFTRHLSLQFNANNLLDEKYYVLDEYDNTYYGAPANYAVTLKMAY